MTIARINQLHTTLDIARATGVSIDQINSYINSSDQTFFYRKMYIAKRGKNKSGEYRTVFKSNHEWLSQLHRGISMMITNSVIFDNHVQGFVKGRSILTNAEIHLGAKKLLHADITNFFDAISNTHIEQALRSIGANEHAVKIITKISTINNFLRQGTRCSPAISNLVCRKLDMEMLSIAKSYDCKYSRYVDDITFSGDTTPSDESIREALLQNGFQLRGNRCAVQIKGRNQYVTGLTITDHIQPRLPVRLKKRIRLIIYYIEKFGIEAHFRNDTLRPLVDSPAELEGMLAFIYSIEPVLARKLYKKYYNSPTSED